MNPLILSAEPRAVAVEVRMPNGSHEWKWSLTDDQKVTLRLMVKSGAAGTMQSRSCGLMVLLAWDVEAQRRIAEDQAAKRFRERRKRYRNIIYRSPSKPVGARTYAPYQYEPARW